ncbi:MAG: hypothetical protein SAL70_40505 [Scytonema sp. PMC 1070.18]|nr:hypothetical protein [Scytonema sp. PMC 1070.18]
MFPLLSQGMTAFFTACVCMLGVSWLQLPRMQKLLFSNKTISIETLQREVHSEQLRLNLLKKMPAFGYDNLIANWVYLSFLQYFGDEEVRAKTGYSLSPDFFEVILARDPRFINAYLSLSSSTSMYAGVPERSIELTEKGLQSLSPFAPERSYYVWRYKGIDELLFLGHSQAAKQSFEKAAEWANQHSDQDSKNVAYISQKTTEFLNRNPDSKFARIATWTMVLNNQVDEKTGQRATREIEALGGKVITHPDGTYKVQLPQQD